MEIECPIEVLVVEDDEADAKTIVEQLGLYGLQLNWLCVSNPSDYSAALADTRWDIVLCDYVVPDMDWESALTQARKVDETIPFIVISGKRGEEYAVETIRGGCNDFFLKERLIRLGPSVIKEITAARQSKQQRKEQIILEVELQRSRRLEAIGQLAGGLAHNLNNVLTAVMGNLDLVLMSDTASQNENTHLKAALRSTEQCALIVRQLTRLAQEPSFEPETVDLEKLAKNVCDLVTPTLPDRIELKLVCDPELPLVVADPIGIEQALLNLLLNARDAILEEGQIVCDFSLQSSQWTIRVSDNGTGIEPDLQDRIFEPFFTTKGIHGTGLGLPSVFQIVKAHGGHVNVVSTVKENTYFEIVVPLVVASENLEYFQPTLRSGTGRVLVVDSSEEIRLVTQGVLDRCGYTVETAAGYRDALDRLERTPNPNVILADSVMPEGGAMELRQWLAERGLNIPIVVTSAFDAEQAGRYRRNEGFADFLPKPYSGVALSEAIANVGTVHSI